MDWKLFALVGLGAGAYLYMKNKNTASGDLGFSAATTAVKPAANNGGWSNGSPSVNVALPSNAQAQAAAAISSQSGTTTALNAAAAANAAFYAQKSAGTVAPANATPDQIAYASQQAGYAAAAKGTPAAVPIYTAAYIATLPTSAAAAGVGQPYQTASGYNTGLRYSSY